MNSKTIVNERTGFEVYLEGIKAPPASIRISENEGGFPSAQVSFPATSAMLRVLPGTKVQIFGKDPLTDEQILLFEGEINSVGYNKSGSSRSVSFSCVSPLSNWNNATARPLDSMVTPLFREAERGYNFNYENLTPNEKQEAVQKPTSAMLAASIAIKNKTDQEVNGPLKDVFDDISMTNFSGYSDEITQILEKDSVSAGEIHILVQYFLRKFEMADPFYGMESAAYNIANSVCTWPNFGKVDPFKNKAAMNSFFRMSTEFKGAFENSGSMVLMEALRSILQTMHYNLLAPTSYTSSHRFQDSGGSPDGKDPIRAYFTPNLENSPPAKFNLLFPHQVMSFNYSRSFDGEPTRTIGEVKLSYLDDTSINMQGASAFLTEPGLNITQKGVEKNSIGLTPEETYRGIKPNFAKFESFFAEAKQNFTGNDKAIESSTKEDYLSLVKPGLTQLTKNSHMRGRMNGRSVSFQTTWSPYRMTGVPGAYIEQGDGPSITGVISSITTNITANGNATSTITFRAPRLVYKKDDVDDDENLINDFSIDPYLDINTSLFDNDVYDFNNIGASLFAYIKNGKFSNKNTSFEEYASGPIEVVVRDEKGKKVTKKHQPFKGNTAKIEKMFSDELAVNEDVSIIDFLQKDDEGNILNALAPELELTPMEDYTRNVYEALYNITDLYGNIEGQGSLIDKWTNNLTYRNIITKRDYFNTLGIIKPESLANCKDGIKLFTGTESLSAIKESIVTNNSTEGTNVSDEAQLISRKNTLQRRIDLIVRSLDTLNSVGELKAGTIREISPVINTLRSRAIGISLEPIPPENKDLWWAEHKDIIISKSQKKAADYIREQDSINDQLEEISNDVSREAPDVSLESVPAEFESELFKPYNLTRRRHVDVALTRYVRNSLKSQKEDDSESDIRQNLNILE